MKADFSPFGLLRFNTQSEPRPEGNKLYPLPVLRRKASPADFVLAGALAAQLEYDFYAHCETPTHNCDVGSNRLGTHVFAVVRRAV